MLDYLLMKIINIAKNVFFVTDRYLESSTKTLEKKKQAFQEQCATNLRDENSKDQINVQNSYKIFEIKVK